MCGCSKDCLILILLRVPQISCFTLSLKCFSSDSENCPNVVIGPLLQFPHPLRAGPVLLTLLFSPQFLHPTEFCLGPTGVCLGLYTFPLFRDSYLFSFHLDYSRSPVSLSALNVSPLTQTVALTWGLGPCFSSLTCRGQVQSY